jgi:hypothetical protein
MTNIIAVLARVYVSDLDAAIPLYQELTEAVDVSRFMFRDVQLARVGPFLLLAGNTAAYQERVATILVSELPPVITAIEDAGGQIIEGPSAAPKGPPSRRPPPRRLGLRIHRDSRRGTFTLRIQDDPLLPTPNKTIIAAAAMLSCPMSCASSGVL